MVLTLAIGAQAQVVRMHTQNNSRPATIQVTTFTDGTRTATKVIK